MDHEEKITILNSFIQPRYIPAPSELSEYLTVPLNNYSQNCYMFDLHYHTA